MKEGWEYKKLGEVCDRITDGSHNPPKGISSSNYLMISSQNVFNDRIILNDVRYLSKDDFLKEDKRTHIKPNDVLLTIVGTIGRCAVVKEEIGNVTLQRSVAVLSPSDLINSRYLMYCCIGNNDNLNKNAHGVAQRGIYLKQLEKVAIPVPSLSDQHQIVSELDLLSGAIEKQKAQLVELDKLAQSTFYDMFGDPVINEKGWSISKYGDEFKIGSGGTPSKSNPEYWEGGDIPWIGSNMCQNCVVYDNDGKYITEKGLRGSSANILKVGTVLIALVGATIGKVALLQKEMATNQNIANINVWDNNNFEPIFIFYHSMNLYHLFIKLGDGGFKMANQSFIRELPLILPPLSLQQEFAAKVEAIEQMKAKVRQSLKETEELFNSRMDYYFN